MRVDAPEALNAVNEEAVPLSITNGAHKYTHTHTHTHTYFPGKNGANICTDIIVLGLGPGDNMLMSSKCPIPRLDH